MVQWLRFQAPSAGSPGSITGRGTRSHMLQLRVNNAQQRPGAAKQIKKKKRMDSTGRFQKEYCIGMSFPSLFMYQ